MFNYWEEGHHTQFQLKYYFYFRASSLFKLHCGAVSTKHDAYAIYVENWAGSTGRIPKEPVPFCEGYYLLAPQITESNSVPTEDENLKAASIIQALSRMSEF